MLHLHHPAEPSPAWPPATATLPGPQYICTFAHPANVTRGTLRRGWLVNCRERFAAS